MSKFCPNCGSPAEDYARVCGKCGTPFPVAQPVYRQPVYQNPARNTPTNPVEKKSDSGKTIMGIIIAVLAVAVIVLGVIVAGSVFNKNSDSRTVADESVDYQTIINDFAKAVETGDGEKFVKYLYGERCVLSENDAYERIETIHNKFRSEFYTNNINVSCSEIFDIKELSKADVYDDCKIRKEGMEVYFYLTAKGGGEERTYKFWLYLVNDRGWKIYNMGFDMALFL